MPYDSDLYKFAKCFRFDRIVSQLSVKYVLLYFWSKIQRLK